VSIKPDPHVLRLARLQAEHHLLPDLLYATALHRFRNDSITLKEYLDGSYGFKNFLTAYGVGRTLMAGDAAKIRILKIIRDFQFGTSHTGSITALAAQLQTKKLSSRTGAGSHGLPRSFASKLLYVYRPDEIIPYDSYVLKSLEIHVCQKLKTLDHYYLQADAFRIQFFPEHGKEVLKLSQKLDKQLHSKIEELQLHTKKLLSWKLTDKYLWCAHEMRRTL
jgi:hypothetical protein